MSMQDLLLACEKSRYETPPRAIPSGPVLIYGAGNKGRQVATFLRAQGHDVIGLADVSASGTAVWEALPIRTLSDWQAHGLAQDTTLVVAIHNHHVNMKQLLEGLAQSDVGRIINPIEFQGIYQGQFPDAYWLTGPAAYEDNHDKLVAVETLLADAVSRTLLRQVVEFRLSGNYAVLPDPTPADQYCPVDLPRWTEPMRFIDAGAFDGDTLRQLKRFSYQFEQIIAFEPDLESYARLSRCIDEFGGGVCLPCGLSRKNSQLNFESNGTGASHIAKDGGQVIQCISIDEAFPGVQPTLIKMDIEGAELDALSGGERTISTHRPALAISIYHHPGHLWQIPLLIASWNLDYRFHLRMHGWSSFDLVLYAIP